MYQIRDVKLSRPGSQGKEVAYLSRPVDSVNRVNTGGEYTVGKSTHVAALPSL